jgi:hypothetical protein
VRAAKDPFLVTELDHENGFKIVPISFRSGKQGTLRLTAPSHRLIDSLHDEALAAGDWGPVLEACLEAEPDGVAQLNKLSFSSAAQLKRLAVELTFGLPEQSKDKAAAASQANPPKRQRHDWRRWEIVLLRSGFSHAEVARFSFPKLVKWLPAARAQITREALTQSAAVWAPEKVAEQLESGSHGGEGAGTESQTPLSTEDFQRLLKESGQAT